MSDTLLWHNTNISCSSNLYSMSPPTPRANSNNPFLDDYTPADRNNSPAPRPVHRERSRHSKQPQKHMTAAEEKEALRRRYLDVDDVDNHGTGNTSGDLPPSYDEISGSKNRGSGYPKDKPSDGRSSESRHRRDRDREHRSGDKDREHRSGDRERRGHHSSSSHRHRKSSSGKKTTSSPDKATSKSAMPKNLDTIDKLDVTGFFGGAFHHDGPFDACTPHRNKNTKAAPVLAFPADGPNSSIAGAIGSKSIIKEVFGHNDLDDEDYVYKSSSQQQALNGNINSSSSTVDAIKMNSKNITQFDPKAKMELVHGPTTIGLGSTTFLDGAPAPTAAIKEDAFHKEHQGVQRKKSLSQRLKVGTKNDDVRLRKVSSDSTPNSPSMVDYSQSFNDYPKDEDVYLGSSSGVRFDSDSKKESTGNKFLRRVKSLKVSRK